MGEPLVGRRDRLLEADPDAGRLVVVVLVADRLGGQPGRLVGVARVQARGHQQVQVALRARDRTDARLDHDERVGRVGEAVVLGDDAELHLESNGQSGPLVIGGPWAIRGSRERAGEVRRPTGPGSARVGRDRSPEEVAGRLADYTRGPARRTWTRSSRTPTPPGAAAKAARSSVPRSRSSWATIGASASTSRAKPASRTTRHAPDAAGTRSATSASNVAIARDETELVLEAELAGSVGDQVADPGHRPTPDAHVTGRQAAATDVPRGRVRARDERRARRHRP